MKRYTLLLVGILILGLFSDVTAYEDRVAIQAIRTLDDTPVDTLYIDSKHQIQVLLENNETIKFMDLPFQIYADSNLTWTWDAQSDGFPPDEHQAITFIPHSRLEFANELYGGSQVFFFRVGYGWSRAGFIGNIGSRLQLFSQ
jgi:hypothetical protein